MVSILRSDMAVCGGKKGDWATPLGNDGQERSEGQRGRKDKKTSFREDYCDLPIALFDFILRRRGLDAQLIVQLGFFHHCSRLLCDYRVKVDQSIKRRGKSSVDIGAKLSLVFADVVSFRVSLGVILCLNP